MTHLRNFVYKGKKITRFRIVKLSNNKFRVEYKYKILWFIPVWERYLKYTPNMRGYYETVEMILPTHEEARRCVYKASRKIIKFKKPDKIIYRW